MEDMSAMDYEILIRRAYECGRYGKKGADADIFRRLVDDEYYHNEKPNDEKLSRKYEAKFAEVKGYVVDAIQQGIKRLKGVNAEESQIDILLDHLSEAKNASNRKELSEVIRKSLDSFIEMKIEM